MVGRGLAACLDWAEQFCWHVWLFNLQIIKYAASSFPHICACCNYVRHESVSFVVIHSVHGCLWCMVGHIFVSPCFLCHCTSTLITIITAGDTLYVWLCVIRFHTFCALWDKKNFIHPCHVLFKGALDGSQHIFRVSFFDCLCTWKSVCSTYHWKLPEILMVCGNRFHMFSHIL